MGIVESKACQRCNVPIGDIFWYCPQVNKLWAEIVVWVKTRLGTEIITDPGILLLNMVHTDTEESPEVAWLVFLNN